MYKKMLVLLDGSNLQRSSFFRMLKNSLDG
jgi:hypothetical protein